MPLRFRGHGRAPDDVHGRMPLLRERDAAATGWLFRLYTNSSLRTCQDQKRRRPERRLHSILTRLEPRTDPTSVPRSHASQAVEGILAWLAEVVGALTEFGFELRGREAAAVDVLGEDQGRDTRDVRGCHAGAG